MFQLFSTVYIVIFLLTKQFFEIYFQEKEEEKKTSWPSKLYAKLSVLRKQSKLFKHTKILVEDDNALITCVKVRPNPCRLLLTRCKTLQGHYQSTMTSHNDSRLWCDERWLRLLLKCQTGTHNAPLKWVFITISNDRHAWTDLNSLTQKENNEWEISLIKYIFIKLPWKCIKNV